jgi:hypothetical protein
MTDHSRELEHRYRRWLALYPKSFRDEHEEEMVSVLMEGTDPSRTRPRAGEALNIARHGLARRRGGGFPSNWEKNHANVMFPLRILIALWLVFISSMLVGFQRGEVWLVLLIPAILLHLYIAFRIRPSAVPR